MTFVAKVVLCRRWALLLCTCSIVVFRRETPTGNWRRPPRVLTSALTQTAIVGIILKAKRKGESRLGTRILSRWVARFGQLAAIYCHRDHKQWRRERTEAGGRRRCRRRTVRQQSAPLVVVIGREGGAPFPEALSHLIARGEPRVD
ncbi:hypothetical protein MRX96_046461 [Rhipicephalus microplus]